MCAHHAQAGHAALHGVLLAVKGKLDALIGVLNKRIADYERMTGEREKTSLLDKDYSFVSKRRRRLLKLVFKQDGSPNDFDMALKSALL